MRLAGAAPATVMPSASSILLHSIFPSSILFYPHPFSHGPPSFDNSNASFFVLFTSTLRACSISPCRIPCHTRYLAAPSLQQPLLFFLLSKRRLHVPYKLGQRAVCVERCRRRVRDLIHGFGRGDRPFDEGGQRHLRVRVSIAGEAQRRRDGVTDRNEGWMGWGGVVRALFEVSPARQPW